MVQTVRSYGPQTDPMLDPAIERDESGIPQRGSQMSRSAFLPIVPAGWRRAGPSLFVRVTSNGRVALCRTLWPAITQQKALRSAIPTERLRVRDACHLGSHRPHSSRSSNIRQRAVGQSPVRFPPDSRDRRAVCRSVAIRQEAETVDSQSRISTAGALSKGHWLCRSLTATETRWRTTPCASRSIPTRMTSWRGTTTVRN